MSAYTVPPRPTVTRYSRQDVLRILRVHPRQLTAWERAGLIVPRIISVGQDSSELDQPYSFEDLSQMRTLRDLQATRISVRSIRASVDAMQRVAGLSNPLLQASMVPSLDRRGSRLSYRYAGALVDPFTQQLAFDFELAPDHRLRVVRSGEPIVPPAVAGLQEMFLRAVRLEEDPNAREQAMQVYREILAIDPNHAPACINLGTIYYTMREFDAAEAMYRHATIADPDYALAFFDLGNVLDELQRVNDAIECYRRAVVLVPGYADAHYNLALAFERKGEKRRALAHWQSYIKLDPVGPWASHAKGQAKKILSSEKLSIVSRFGKHCGKALVGSA
jgi:tetratricopeptide (TPR) repeat protein